jgi:hypothetical protein
LEVQFRDVTAFAVIRNVRAHAPKWGFQLPFGAVATSNKIRSALGVTLERVFGAENYK